MKKPRLIILGCLVGILGASTVLPSAMAQTGGDIRRRTVAITYFKDPIRVDMSGTTISPGAHGEGTVERWRKRNESEIKLKVEGLAPPYTFGGDYNTYVLWAITPEGQVANLGEFKLTGGTGNLHAATPDQTFAMIVTAEPYYMVKRPSRMVVLTNLAPSSKKVEVQSSEIYFTGDSGQYYTDTTVPATAERDFAKTPSELLQARRAFQIAKMAGGEQYDRADLKSAEDSLQEAEGAFRRGANLNDVGRICREAISYSERTREISEDRSVAAARRAEIQRRDDELRRAGENASDLQTKLTSTEARLQAEQISRTNAEDQLNRSLREAADLRSEQHNLQEDNDRLRTENDRLTKQLAEAQSQVTALQSQVSSASSKLAEETSVAEAAAKAEAERKRAEARRDDIAVLRSELSRFLTVKPASDGFVAVIPDNFFVINKTALALRVKVKMDQLGHALAAHPDAAFTVEGYSDPRPTADEFALGRAQAVADYITALGVPRDNFKVESGGDSNLISNSRAARSRALNRRVELVFAGLK
ncbi:MAG TPA: OmpA family protein [Blastocatellia bacterium]|nr:OmpA family protein [Blastocatellia bacterium]